MFLNQKVFPIRSWTLWKRSRRSTFIPFSRDAWVLLWVLPSVTLREDILPKSQLALNMSKAKSLKKNFDLRFQQFPFSLGGGLLLLFLLRCSSEISISQFTILSYVPQKNLCLPYHVHNHLVFSQQEKAVSNKSSGKQIESCQLTKIWRHPPFLFQQQ